MKGSGVCGVCWGTFKTHALDGTVHRHGPRKSPCTGSDQAPADVLSQPAATAHSNSQQSTHTSCTLPLSSSATDRESLSHPVGPGTPLIKRIPKAARPACAGLLVDILKAVVQTPDSTDRWSELLSFGHSVLAKPKRGGNNRSLVKIIQERVSTWQSGNYSRESHEVAARRPTLSARRGNNDANRYLARAVSAKLEEGNIKGAVRLVCSEDKPAPCTAETLTALRQKHPPAAPDRRPACCPTSSPRFEAPQVLDVDIARAIRSFPAGSAGGPDGITPQHLKDLTAPGVSGDLLEVLVEFVNTLLNGGLPDNINEVLYGGNLLAVQKKDGGIRPIAIGYTWRRLAAKCANAYVVGKMAAVLAPLQLGVGVPGGAEAAIHATRRYVSTMPDSHVVVKLDFTNAFNTLRRDCMLEAVASEVPELYRFVYASYAVEPILDYGAGTVRSREGPQQGDPLGPLEFCVTIQPLLKRLQSELRIGFLDDLTLGGYSDVVASDVDLIDREAAALGLKLNKSKCEVIGNSEQVLMQSAFVGFRSTSVGEMRLLGAPVMPGLEVSKALDEKTQDLQRAVSRLTLLQAQDALTLLRHSLSIPKLMYTLRTSDCQSSPALTDFDKTLRDGLSAILNVDLSGDQWQQASLPVRDGGLGIRSAVLLAPSAFLASAAGTTELQARILPPTIAVVPDSCVASCLKTWSIKSQSSVPTGEAAQSQRNWDSPCIQTVKDELLDHAQHQRDRARLLASQAAHSADWLFALPISAIGLRLTDEAVRVAVGMRLGVKVCEEHLCPCGATVDTSGTHGLSCRRSAGRQQRHSLINDIIWRAMIRARIQAVKEPPGLTRSDGKRPDGVTLIPWTRGRCLSWDVTVPDTMAASHLDRTSLTAGAAAERAAELKTSKYADLLPYYDFVPISVETFGVWSESALVFVKALGKRLADVTSDPLETAYLLQRLSVAIVRCNEICFTGSFKADER